MSLIVHDNSIQHNLRGLSGLISLQMQGARSTERKRNVGVFLLVMVLLRCMLKGRYLLAVIGDVSRVI